MNQVEKPEKLSEVEAIRSHELSPDESRARLLELLGDGDEDVRAEAAAAILEHSDEAQLVERALELSTKDGSPRVRAKAMTALGRIVYEGSVSGADEPSYQPDPLLGEPPAALFRKVRDHLLAAAHDEKRSFDERRFALEGLGFLGDDHAVASLIESFWKRSEPAARLSAIFAMGRSGDARWTAQIREALASKDEELRLQAIWAAGEAEVQPARDALITLAKAGRAEQRLAAIEALARIGGDQTAQVLLSLAERDPDPEIREGAAQGLEELALLESLDDDGDADEDEG